MTANFGLWRSLVAHLTGGQGVVGSHPASPTVFPGNCRFPGFFLSWIVLIHASMGSEPLTWNKSRELDVRGSGSVKDCRRALLERLWEEGRQFDAQQENRLDRRRNLEPASAELLNIIVQTVAPASVVEIGTSNGFSAMWIAEALESSGGTLLTVDNDAGRAVEVAANLDEAGPVAPSRPTRCKCSRCSCTTAR